LNYKHQNPVEADLAFRTEFYPFSSAIYYAVGEDELNIFLMAKK